MLSKNFDFENPNALKQFRLKSQTHKETWAEYYESYNYGIKKIIEKGLQRNYALNCRAKGILFLIRHSIELCLKLNLNRIIGNQPNTHIFGDLMKLFPDESTISENIKKIMDIINYDSDGSCYRYPINNQTKKPYFKYTDVIEVGVVLELHNDIERNDNFIVGKWSESHDFRDRRIKWDLSFHLGEANQIGTLRTQYDLCIEYLIEGVLIDNNDIDKLYIPLLFLIRHSLELALKSNIQEIQKVSTLIKSKDYSNEHSLSTLFNCYNDYLDKIEMSKLQPDMQNQLAL